ncbi:hypothetical protein EYF80_030538 [Liparis tanakae]|uniref:Uncharacterized protein n=1 Tax=Liparis tanakae TaxID=230148 RepID=A0A4Z2H2E1_9TELE|nr:hypothetical protein EYF80_030538 [Liparis tanakae]
MSKSQNIISHQSPAKADVPVRSILGAFEVCELDAQSTLRRRAAFLSESTERLEAVALLIGKMRRRGMWLVAVCVNQSPPEGLNLSLHGSFFNSQK